MLAQGEISYQKYKPEFLPLLFTPIKALLLISGRGTRYLLWQDIGSKCSTLSWTSRLKIVKNIH